MRDPTRGGLASALNEIAQASGVQICLEESAIRYRPRSPPRARFSVSTRCTLPTRVVLVAIVERDVVDTVVAAMRTMPEGSSACAIGTVIDATTSRVVMSTLVGSRRIVDMLIGEQLPRIC